MSQVESETRREARNHQNSAKSRHPLEDEDLYYRLMQEVFVYLGQNRWRHGWQAVVFWAKRSLDTGIPRCYDGEVQTGYLRSQNPR
ncbi:MULTISPECIES: DUF2887 domain-containing protein [unclassified Moorena]|uniref:DUF2887 domain-containing protein n=1 Tax=unclassified Moorena TaxID=2683338 RepID=UPI0013C56971|nr:MULTISPECIES: DUF2887 domain-containing protein [unclassified Moorena]NEO18740.1 DUF2887 domain-containing protein [Moorena sp. SIO4A5]NEP24228.1 DUF2887 domain-containing protein [Moorena sp. SIO3I6]NEQ62023.1 DUF2887 domain-containing protein [Moorena sp. SIO4A1]